MVESFPRQKSVRSSPAGSPTSCLLLISSSFSPGLYQFTQVAANAKQPHLDLGKAPAGQLGNLLERPALQVDHENEAAVLRGQPGEHAFDQVARLDGVLGARRP